MIQVTRCRAAVEIKRIARIAGIAIIAKISRNLASSDEFLERAQLDSRLEGFLLCQLPALAFICACLRKLAADG